MTWRSRTVLGLALVIVCVVLAGAAEAQSCTGDVEIVAVGQNGGPNTVDIAMNNNTSSPQKTYVVLGAMLGTLMPLRISVVEELMLPAGASMTVRFTFADDVSPVSADACADRPTGITESPDPYAMKLIPDEGDEEDEGTN